MLAKQVGADIIAAKENQPADSSAVVFRATSEFSVAAGVVSRKWKDFKGHYARFPGGHKLWLKDMHLW